MFCRWREPAKSNGCWWVFGFVGFHRSVLVVPLSSSRNKLLEIKIYNSYEQLDVIKTELLGNSIEIEIKIEII